MFVNIKITEDKLFEHLNFLDRFIRKIDEKDFAPANLKELFEEIAKYFKIDHIYLVKNNNLNFWSLNFEWVSERKKSKLYLSGNWEKFPSLLNYLSLGNYLTDEE
ncbi:MAG: hypothetical protein N3A61_02340, partial [Ignavibacteria bacterium]|nr:hypothetical protein [Ignavibacteria bacterium]